jgi:tyrosinase
VQAILAAFDIYWSRLTYPMKIFLVRKFVADFLKPQNIHFMKERKNVYKLASTDSTLEWYAKAISDMKKRHTTDPKSWTYQAAMHGFTKSSPFWKGAEPLPPKKDRDEFWKRCQHQTWFFLPWHRMYLAFFEQIVGDTVVELGGPKDWALPFWDYSDATNPEALTMPKAFTHPADVSNELWIGGRDNTVLEQRYVSLEALKTVPFVGGDGRTAPVGFGGPETSFTHFGNLNGKLEELPHNMVHGYIGGAMGDANTAALDPVFWLHHANIDRLWQVWINNAGGRTDPLKSTWLDFTFDFHDSKSKKVEMKCKDVEDTRKVLTGYTYEGVPPGLPKPMPRALAKAHDFSSPLEVVAATNDAVPLSTSVTTVHLSLTPSKRKKGNFKAAARNQVNTQQKSVLHFENVTGKGVPSIQDVFLNLSANGKIKEAHYAGSISFFGLDEASTPGVHSPGSGQHYALDVTELMSQLRTQPNWNEEQLEVSIEPVRQKEANNSVRIGRISLYSA